MKIVFLAGPYRGRGEPGEIARNIEQSARFQLALARANVVAYSPNIHDTQWEIIRKESLEAAKTLKQFTEMVLRDLATALVVMPGWETSVGTKVEIDFAKKKGIPIFYLRSENDFGGLEEWYHI